MVDRGSPGPGLDRVVGQGATGRPGPRLAGRLLLAGEVGWVSRGDCRVAHHRSSGAVRVVRVGIECPSIARSFS